MTSFVSRLILTVILCVRLSYVCPQLTVNVKNKGDEVLKQKIVANTTKDVITLEFTKSDGTMVTQFIDFKNEIQIFRSIVLGEEEMGQNNYQVLCFIVRFVKNEFISSDAMSKLRQKNPGAVRQPEEDKGRENHVQDAQVRVMSSNPLSPHIQELCADAKDSTYTREGDLKIIARSPGKQFSSMLAATTRLSPFKVSRCKDTSDLYHHCACRYEICVGWYPCGLKYCRGKDNGKPVSYRCGIKTCRKCRVFDYFVKRKSLCLWDE